VKERNRPNKRNELRVEMDGLPVSGRRVAGAIGSAVREKKKLRRIEEVGVTGLFKRSNFTR
jgi:hypothetical protein